MNKQKHFVVLEFTPEQDGDVNGIPWVDLLAGGVKVTNWQYVAAPMSYEDAIVKGMHECIHSHEFNSDNEAIQSILTASKMNLGIPNQIQICEELEDIPTAKMLVDKIDALAKTYVGTYMPLPPASLQTGTIE